MPLPRSVQEVADVIGREPALKLIESIEPFERADRRYPGKKWKSLMLYVPKALRPNDPLVAVIGLEGAQLLISHFGGEMLSLAACAKARQVARNRLICALIDQGVAPCEVAEMVGITKSYVRKIAREMPPEARVAGRGHTHGHLGHKAGAHGLSAQAAGER